MQQNKMTPYKKIYISLVIFGTLFLLFVFLIYLLALNQIKKDTQDLVFQRDVYFSLKSKEGTLEKLSKDYQNLRPELAKINDLFLDPENPIKFLNYLEKTGNSLGLSVKTSSLSFSQDEKNPWSALCLQVFLTSDFSSFTRFLESLENSPFVLQLQNLNLEKTNNEVAVSISLTVFTK